MTRPPIQTPIAFALTLLSQACTSPGRMHEYLDDAGSRYSESRHMVGDAWRGPSYHTKLSAGTFVHGTVASLDYALALLARGRAEDQDRAQAICREVISLQVTDPSDKYYGVWPWFHEEPVAEMAPPDKNWADFCGVRLAQLLADHGDSLDTDLVQEAREALRRAARAIRYRDSSPGYTNIAIMGACATAAAGELLNDPELLAWGREKLERVVVHTRFHSNFAEYNSPNYTLVALQECERTLHLVVDDGARRAAEILRRVAWRTIAESFHPPTNQWAGPHSRVYADRLTRQQALDISRRIGALIPVHTALRDQKLHPWSTTPALPCPSELRKFFHESPGADREVRRTFFRAEDERDSIVGTTWMDDVACIGSISRSCLWVQRRPVVAFWRTEKDPAIVLKMRALKDGRDFSALGVRSAQRGAHVLSAFYLLADRGDWHRHLDRPENSTYRTGDLRIRYELQGVEVSVTRVRPGTFELRAGRHRGVLLCPPGEFFGGKVRWTTGRADGRVFVDAILHRGDVRSFDFRKGDAIRLAVSLELVRDGTPPTDIDQTRNMLKNWSTRFSAQ